MAKIDQKKLKKVIDKIYKDIREEMLKEGYTNEEIDELFKNLG